MPRQKSLSPEIIDLAIAGIDAKITELRQQREQLLAGRSSTAKSTSSSPTAKQVRGRKKGGKMSAEARRLISEKLKARWAERKRASSGSKVGGKK